VQAADKTFKDSFDVKKAEIVLGWNAPFLHLSEVSRNYFAISKQTCDAFYFREDVDEYENGKIKGHEGSWLSGVVGEDPEAEAHWIGAINDPTLPAEESKDLIEDLNEDGVFDPHHPNVDDLPLIYSQLS
jgi:hypothetical protein